MTTTQVSQPTNDLPPPSPPVDAAAETTPASPTINVVDIENAVKVIDYAFEQGAYKGVAIVKQVITVRDRLNDFVLAVAPKEPEGVKETPPKNKKRNGRRDN